MSDAPPPRAGMLTRLLIAALAALCFQSVLLTGVTRRSPLGGLLGLVLLTVGPLLGWALARLLRKDAARSSPVAVTLGAWSGLIVTAMASAIMPRAPAGGPRPAVLLMTAALVFAGAFHGARFARVPRHLAVTFVLLLLSVFLWEPLRSCSWAG